MRSGASAPLALDGAGHGMQAFARRQVGRLAGAALLAAVVFAVASLATWNVADPSFSHATANPVTNAMGYPGAVFSDLAMQFFGLSAVAGLVPAVVWALLNGDLTARVAAKAALEDAGYGADREFNRAMTSVILGVTGTLELVVPLGARLGHPYWRKALQESGLEPALVEEVMTRISADYVPWQENSFPGLLRKAVAGAVHQPPDLPSPPVARSFPGFCRPKISRPRNAAAGRG